MSEERCGKCKYCIPIVDQKKPSRDCVVGLVCGWNYAERTDNEVYLIGADDEPCEDYDEEPEVL